MDQGAIARMVRLYEEDRWAAARIGDELDISETTVFRHLRAAGIRIRKNREREIYLDEDELRQMYIEESLSTRQIARRLGVSANVVTYSLRRFKIPIRPACRVPESLEVRLRRYIVIGDIDECWLWIGRRDRDGYGSLSVDRTSRHVTRIIWELLFGQIPSGLCVCHTCDNPPCCNPKHLWLGTNQDNVNDMMAKGRHVVGNRKLSAEQVLEIRDLVKRNEISNVKIAELYGVSNQLVGLIARRKIWVHV
jgi:biotin operon repressor